VKISFVRVSDNAVSHEFAVFHNFSARRLLIFVHLCFEDYHELEEC
jgi:hypothetical protein